MIKRLTAVCVSVWFGVQVGFAYVLAPILFRTFDKSVAGELAGQMFHISHYIGMAVWLLAAWAMARRTAWEYGTPQRGALKWTGLLLLLFAVSEWLVSPTISSIKAGENTLLTQWFGQSFAMWHGVSQVFYLLQTLLGLGLIIKYLRWQD